LYGGSDYLFFAAFFFPPLAFFAMPYPPFRWFGLRSAQSPGALCRLARRPGYLQSRFVGSPDAVCGGEQQLNSLARPE
jgi:hypothetical protein